MIRILESLDNKEGKLVVDVKDSEGQLKELIDYIKDVTNAGHTFDVVVDPGNEDWEKSFEIDGDGAFSIKDVKFEKDNENDDDEIEIKEESIRSIDAFKKENELTDEMIDTLKEFYNSKQNKYFKDLTFVDWLYKIRNYERGIIYSEILEDYADMAFESKNVKKESVNSEDDFILALTDVLKSMRVLNELWHQWDVVAKCLNNEKYPFDKSFDEVCEDVNVWLEETKKISLNG